MSPAAVPGGLSDEERRGGGARGKGRKRGLGKDAAVAVREGGEREGRMRRQSAEGGGQKRGISAAHATVCSTVWPTAR